MALSAGKDVLVINPASPTDIILKITLKNSWEGLIGDVRSLTMVIPKGFGIKDVAGKDPKEQVKQLRCDEMPGNRDVSAGCDNAKHNVYVIPMKKEPIQLLRNIRAYLSLDDPDSVVGKALYNVQTFKLFADYTYRIERQAEVRVQ